MVHDALAVALLVLCQHPTGGHAADHRVEVVPSCAPIVLQQAALLKVGDGLYRTGQAPQPATEARLVQGMLESSNVRPIVEMTEMMSIVRAYQGTQRLLEMHHELQRQSIERLLEVTG